MAHQSRADASPLVGIVHGEGDLGLIGLPDDVACPADDHRLSILLQRRDEGDVAGEVDLEVEVDLLVGEAALEGEEAPVEGLVAVRPTAASRPARSSCRRARTTTWRPSRRVSMAE